MKTRARFVGWRGGGSTSADSSGQGSTFQARGASFEEIEELLLVQGMTPELFYGNYVADADGRLSPRGGLRDSLSVWGAIEQFDANAASPALLWSWRLRAGRYANAAAGPAAFSLTWDRLPRLESLSAGSHPAANTLSGTSGLPVAPNPNGAL
jgi:hypothetical protein